MNWEIPLLYSINTNKTDSNDSDELSSKNDAGPTDRGCWSGGAGMYECDNGGAPPP